MPKLGIGYAKEKGEEIPRVLIKFTADELKKMGNPGYVRVGFSSKNGFSLFFEPTTDTKTGYKLFVSKAEEKRAEYSNTGLSKSVYLTNPVLLKVLLKGYTQIAPIDFIGATVKRAGISEPFSCGPKDFGFEQVPEICSYGYFPGSGSPAISSSVSIGEVKDTGVFEANLNDLISTYHTSVHFWYVDGWVTAPIEAYKGPLNRGEPFTFNLCIKSQGLSNPDTCVVRKESTFGNIKDTIKKAVEEIPKILEQGKDDR